MEINKVNSAIQLILFLGDATARKDVEIIIATLEIENEIRFEIIMTSEYESCCNDFADKIKESQEKRYSILKKYSIEPF